MGRGRLVILEQGQVYWLQFEGEGSEPDGRRVSEALAGIGLVFGLELPSLSI